MVKKSMKSTKKGGGGCWKGGCAGGSRRMRGGMYGFNGGVITAGTLEAGAAYSGAADPKTGAAVPDPALKGTPNAGDYTGVGGRRRKTSKKTRKGRKGSKKSRKMRGGASQISMGGTYASFGGKGEAGLATFDQGVKGGNPY